MYNTFMQNKIGKVWSVFPLCGKTYCANLVGIDAVDSDSSYFSWVEEDGKKVRNPEFPKNYIEHIKDAITKHEYVFVSSHQEVRDALNNENIPFTLVYPHRNCLSEWIKRYNEREYNGFPLQVLVNNWEKWHDELDAQECENKIILNNNDFLINIL